MSRRWWILLGALAVAAVVLGAAVLDRNPSTALPSGSPLAVATPTTPTTSTPPSASTSPTPATAPSPAPTATPQPTPPAATPPPRASGPPALAYAEFLRRVNDDRSTVEALNGALSTAAQAQDPAAVRRAAVDILDFVDVERDWLRDNPPAECYANAHAAAGAMLEAYGAAADAFITWAETGGGFAGLGALADAVTAAESASDALEGFGRALEATSCPA
jgi:hypothetical protein